MAEGNNSPLCVMWWTSVFAGIIAACVRVAACRYLAILPQIAEGIPAIEPDSTIYWKQLEGGRAIGE